MVVVRVVLTSSKKWTFEAKKIKQVLKELDKVRDKVYYLKSYSGARSLIQGINETKKFFKYYQKRRIDPPDFIYEVRIEPNRIYIWLEGPVRETDMAALLYAFDRDEIAVECSGMKYREAYRVKVW